MPARTIRTIVNHQKILTLAAGTTVLEAARRMVEARVGSVLVVAGGKLIGIFTERDALARVLARGADPKTTTIEAVMTRDPLTVHPDKPLGYALHMMYDGGFRHVPVIENGKPIGMISARDALGPELVQFENELQQREDLTKLM